MIGIQKTKSENYYLTSPHTVKAHLCDASTYFHCVTSAHGKGEADRLISILQARKYLHRYYYFLKSNTKYAGAVRLELRMVDTCHPTRLRRINTVRYTEAWYSNKC